ncbi:MAG: hypothetical protein BWX80_03077 [Candidatus Hydrogenedentes bacterium ADurb.Bin101]|nr:MAG: hypothetical protein BWX80_03077 [Candidatus Hydrogenedentes bacterium ADurb.Bin101]
MDAAVIKFDALADAVGAAAQHQHLFARYRRDFIRGVVRGEIIGGIDHAADGNGFPRLGNAQAQACFADILLRNFQQHGQVLVAKTVLLCLDKQGIGRQCALACAYPLLEFHQFLHLFNKITVDIGTLV